MKKERYLQIFNYLKEFSKLRSNPVRDIEIQETQYPEKFWLNDIPESELFENVIRANFNNENDYWIKVRKPKEPTKPTFAKLSEKLELWVEPSSLLSEENEPYLQDKIQFNNTTSFIEDNPEIITELNTYVNGKWIDDLIEYKAKIEIFNKKHDDFERLNTTYKKLFRIYNKTQQFGEEYELVIGIGLLNYKGNTNSQKIFRHILTQRVDINFEYSQKDSNIYISPNLESTIQIETDSIIDQSEQFDSQNIIDAEKAVENYIKVHLIDTLFSERVIEDALQMFAERVSPDGSYDNKIEKPINPSQKPVISYSPALLLRKRNTKSFTSLYEKIIDTIENNETDIDIPTINDLIGIHNTEDSGFTENQDWNSGVNNESIYFPKEYNDEQVEIIEKARKNNKVLVQGPPGTGKSHTIANLICHLLANGKKLLITAYSKRALEVLKEKLPIEFQSLTVNLLSGDSSSIQDLQSSVNSINDELSRANLSDYQKVIESLSSELKIVRERVAFNTNELIKIKEKATRKIYLNPTYSGTLTQIAELLEKDLPKYQWYKDSFSEIENNQIISDLEQYIDSHKNYKLQDLSEIDSILPITEKLPTFEKLQDYKFLVDSILKFQNTKSEYLVFGCDNYDYLKTLLIELNDFYIQADNVQLDFKQKLINSYLKGESFEWNQKLESTSHVIKRIEGIDFKRIDKDIEVTYISGKSLKQLKNDAQILLNYLKAGNPLSGLSFTLKKAFLPKDIKERLYFIDGVRVNGSQCDTIAEFETVIYDIELRQDLEEISTIWEKDNLNSNSYLNKFNYFRNIHSEVTRLIKIIEESETHRIKIEKYSNLSITPFDKLNISNLIVETEYNYLLQKIELFKKLETQTENYLNQKNFHTIKIKLLDAIKQIDLQAYQNALSELNSISHRRKVYINFVNLQESLSEFLPDTVEAIQVGDFDKSNIVNLQEAIYFRHAQNEVSKLIDVEYEQQMLLELSELEIKEKKLIAKLAAKKSWYKVVDGLQQNSSLRRHLDAWVMAVKKIGKTGKGKRAMKFRKIAQQEMEFCKDSIPCWIMPLYKVAETIQPEQEMYDYVIIDEASQLGPDAIFLLFITKNIIIVGDDKQTSPEYVGVDANTMNPHIKRHLKNIPFSDYYGTEFSFFDHAKIFCDGVTVLREHFRCMPEIIEFSNKNFYAPDGKGLYPLKQYSENRLEPLMSVFCSKGFTDGIGSKIINEPEANKISETIANLIGDVRYKNKTFGVITLQGGQQSSLIENLLLKSIGEQEFHKRKIICGNSSSFQGDERDIIFLSLVTAPNHNRSALVKSEDERRFNVAVSRAKEQIWLFHSIHLEDLGNSNDLRYKLLDHFKNYNSKQLVYTNPINKTIGSQPAPFDSWFEVDIYNDIVSRNLSVIPQYEVAKGRYRIDLVALFEDGTKIAIECDGDKWHGSEQYLNDLMRQKVLERCGWQFVRIRGYEYYTNREKALEPLWNMIKITDSQSLITNNLIELSNEPNIVIQIEEETSEEEYEEIEINNDLIEEIEINNDLIEESEVFSHPMILEKNLSSLFNYEPIKQNIKHDNGKNDNEIVRYFNLFKTGDYSLNLQKVIEADYIIPIRVKHKDGYLLQCYESGHINKVRVSLLLSKKLDRKYMNGLNINDTINKIEIIESECIIGISFHEKGEPKFKAHLTEKISVRDQLQLQGYKVTYNDFLQIKHILFPMSFYYDIDKLIFNSFTASGKSFNNPYYSKEWTIIENYIKQNDLKESKQSINDQNISNSTNLISENNNDNHLVNKNILQSFNTSNKIEKQIKNDLQINFPSDLIEKYFDIIDSKNSDVLNFLDRLVISSTRFFPIFAFSLINNQIKSIGVLKQLQISKLKKTSLKLEKDQNKFYHNRLSDILGDFQIATSFKTHAITWNILMGNISLNDVEVFLRNYEDKQSTEYNRMLCAYDFKKYSNFAGTNT